MKNGQGQDFVSPRPDITQIVYLASKGSGNAEKIVTGSRDGSVRLWHQDGFKETLLHTPHEVMGVAVSPDNRRIAACGNGDALRIWCLQSKKLTLIEGEKSYPTAVALGLKDRGAYCDMAGLHLFQGESVVTVRKSDEWCRAHGLAYSPDHTRIAVGAIGGLGVVCSQTGEMLQFFRSATVVSFAWFPEGDRIVYTDIFFPDGKPVHATSVVDLTHNESRRLPYNDVARVAVTPDGRHIVTATLKGCVRVLRSDDFSVVNAYAFARPLYALAVSPSGNTIAIGLSEGRLCLRSLEKQECDEYQDCGTRAFEALD